MDTSAEDVEVDEKTRKKTKAASMRNYEDIFSIPTSSSLASKKNKNTDSYKSDEDFIDFISGNNFFSKYFLIFTGQSTPSPTNTSSKSSPVNKQKKAAPEKKGKFLLILVP